MSLIRNERGSTNQTLTAKRFVAGEPISGNSYRPIEYIQVENGYIGNTRKLVMVNSASSFIIKAEFSQGASGTLIGRADGLQIVKDGSYIKWKNSSTVLHQVAWKEGLQLYGFVRTNTGTLPYYEGEVITSASPVVTFSAMTMMLGIATDSNGDVTGNPISSATWRVSEVIGYLLYSDGSTSKQMTFHWYATRRSSSQAPILFETRSDSSILDLGCFTGQGRTYTAGDDVTYGMQVDDLKIAFGSPYQDLLMILCGDGYPSGIDRKAGWVDYSEHGYLNNWNWAVAPATFTVDNILHRLAFHIPSSRIKGNPTVTAPTYPSESGQGSWDEGELYYGRKPKWDIWNDAVKAFKYIRKIPVYNGTILMYYKYQLAYNIFRDAYGRDMTQYGTTEEILNDQLLTFDGYNTAAAGKHYPAITTPTNSVKLYFYADQNFERAANKSYDTPVYAYDRQSPSQTITVKLGNLPWWNLTKAEQDALVTQIGHTLRVFGVYGTLQHYAATGGGWVDLANFVALSTAKDSNDQWIPFCKENLDLGSNGDAPAFRDNGVQASLNFGDNGVFYRFEDEDRTRVVIRMAMAHQTNLNIDTQTIDCSNLVPGKMVKTASVKYEYNLRLVGTFTNTGTLKVGLVDNETTRQIYLRKYNTYEGYYIGVNTSYGALVDRRALGIQFAIKGDNDSNAVDLFPSSHTRDANGYIVSDYLVYVTCTFLKNFSMLIGAEPSKVYVGQYSEFQANQSGKTHFLDSPSGTIYHKSGSSFVQDADNTNYDELSELENIPVADRSHYTNYWIHMGTVLYRWGEDNEWHRLPEWYYQGTMLAKYSGWAQPFHNNDGRQCFISQGPYGGRMPWLNTNLVCPNVDAQGTYKTLDIAWKEWWPNQEYVTNGSDKVADAVIYPEHMALGNPVTISGSGGEYSPTSVVRYRVFKKTTAPHTCGPYMSSGSYQISQGNTLYWYVDFLDKCENYAFYLNSNKNGYKYVVVGDDTELAYNNTIVVDVWLRLYNGSNVDKTTDEEYESHKFKLSLFKQTPCTPYKQVAGTGSDSDVQEYDTTWRLTPIFIGQTMPSIGSSQTVTKDGVTYTIRMFSAQTHNGVYPELAGQNKKYMVSNPTCFNLGVTASTTPEPGTKYIYVISPV